MKKKKNIYVELAQEWAADNSSVSHQELKHYADGAKLAYKRAYKLAADPASPLDAAQFWAKADKAFLALDTINAAIKASAYVTELTGLINRYEELTK